MAHQTLHARVRGLVVAGIIGGATITGLATAHAAPAQSPSQPAVTTVAADCQAYWPSPYTVCGEIRDLYNTLGGPSGSLSFPTAAEVTNPDGSKYSTFINGTIHWSTTTGAYVG